MLMERKFKLTTCHTRIFTDLRWWDPNLDLWWLKNKHTTSRARLLRHLSTASHHRELRAPALSKNTTRTKIKPKLHKLHINVWVIWHGTVCDGSVVCHYAPTLRGLSEQFGPGLQALFSRLELHPPPLAFRQMLTQLTPTVWHSLPL